MSQGRKRLPMTGRTLVVESGSNDIPERRVQGGPVGGVKRKVGN